MATYTPGHPFTYSATKPHRKFGPICNRLTGSHKLKYGHLVRIGSKVTLCGSSCDITLSSIPGQLAAFIQSNPRIPCDKCTTVPDSKTIAVRTRFKDAVLQAITKSDSKTVAQRTDFKEAVLRAQARSR